MHCAKVGSASGASATHRRVWLQEVDVLRLVALALGLFIIVDKLGPQLPRGSGFLRELGVLSTAADGEAGRVWESRQLGASAATGATGNAGAASATDHNDNSTEHAGSSDHGEGGHPHEALFFLVAAIIAGTLLMHAASFPLFKGMQQTVVLFVLGCITSLVMSGMRARQHLGPLGRSYDMWMTIDPHLLLFTLLPPLLAGDAMTIDTVVAEKVARQCLYLAGPGVVFNATLTALFLWAYLPYNWPPMLCLTTGSILCATDPVAVVALLKELGASPTLTVQIQGESLLNDGTAIVMFTVAYNMLKGKDYSTGDIMTFLVEAAFYAWLLGMVIGFLFFCWIRMAKNKLVHSCSTIQVLLTIACAYSSFIIAEGIFRISGVLSTVAASLLLARQAWPEIVSHETMHTVWHMLENLGNTIIFFLAGALTGNIMLKIPVTDFLHLFVIYFVLLALRFTLLVCSRPVLRLLVSDRQPVTLADAIVMSWGGLRGAVGLALGIQVSMTRGGGNISELDANRVFFYVGGVALLTLVVNALSCPALVHFLQITNTPETKRKLMMMIHRQLEDEVQGNEEVQKAVSTLLEKVKQHISSKEPRHTETEDHHGGIIRLGFSRVRASVLSLPAVPAVCKTEDVVAAFKAEVAEFARVPAETRDHLLALSPLPGSCVFDFLDAISELLLKRPVDTDMLRAVNEAFLALVRTQYWQQLERGEVSSSDAELLLGSVTTVLSARGYDVWDLNALLRDVSSDDVLVQSASCRLSCGPEEKRRCLRGVCESKSFHMVIFLAIIANSVFIIIDQYRTNHGQGELSWFILELVFTAVFTIEFVLKFAYMRCRYFGDAWNLFDFSLVLLGIAGVVTYWMTLGVFHNSRVAQTVRIFKVLRAVRLVRLFKTYRMLRAALIGGMESLERSKRLQKFVLLLSLIRAHLQAQRELLRFLGEQGRPNSPEVARCVLQSLSSCYKALRICAQEEMDLDACLLEERNTCLRNISVTEKMECLVNEAHESGILSTSEASMVNHRMHEHWTRYLHQIEDVREGRAGPVYFAAHERCSTRECAREEHVDSAPRLLAL